MTTFIFIIAGIIIVVTAIIVIAIISMVDRDHTSIVPPSPQRRPRVPSADAIDRALWQFGSSAFWLDPDRWTGVPIGDDGRLEPFWMHLDNKVRTASDIRDRVQITLDDLDAATLLTTGTNNVGIGYQALMNVTTGHHNTAIGMSAAYSGNNQNRLIGDNND